MVDSTNTGVARGNPAALAVIPFLVAVAAFVYAVMEAVASATAREVSLRVSAASDPLVRAGLPDGAHLVWPYHVLVPIDALPLGCVTMVKLADVLLPLGWGAAALCIGLVCRQAGWAETIFDGGVMRAVRRLRWVFIAILALPYLLRVLGSTWATTSWEAGLSTSTALGSIWIPVLGMYLCLVFEFILRRGANLQGELDEVI